MRAVALVALVLLAGCSGQSTAEPTTAPAEPTTAPAASPSGRAAYVAKADAACARARASHPEIARSLRGLQGLTMESPGALPKLAKHYDLVRRVARDFATEFEAIEPPADDRERIDELNGVNEDAIDLLDKAVPELRAGRNPEALFQQYAEKISTANELAAAYGFEVCSRTQG